MGRKKLRHTGEPEPDPLAEAIATPDEPLDAERYLTLYRRRVTWQELGDLQSGRRTSPMEG